MRNHLKLVWVNPNPPKKSLFDKIVDWFCKPREIILPPLPWQKTQEEKAAILKSVLTNAFADYDYTTGDVNIFPPQRAESEVKAMIEQGTLDYYFDRHLASQKHLAQLDKMQQKFEGEKRA